MLSPPQILASIHPLHPNSSSLSLSRESQHPSSPSLRHIREIPRSFHPLAGVPPALKGFKPACHPPSTTLTPHFRGYSALTPHFGDAWPWPPPFRGTLTPDPPFRGTLVSPEYQTHILAPLLTLLPPPAEGCPSWPLALGLSCVCLLSLLQLTILLCRRRLDRGDTPQSPLTVPSPPLSSRLPQPPTACPAARNRFLYPRCKKKFICLRRGNAALVKTQHPSDSKFPPQFYGVGWGGVENSPPHW